MNEQSHKIRSLFCSLTVALVLGMSSHEALAFNAPRFWSERGMTFVSNGNPGQMAIGTQAANEVFAATDVWERVGGHDFEFGVTTNCISCPQFGVNDGINYLEFGPLTGAVGLTLSTYVVETGRVLDADIRIDESIDYSLDPGSNLDTPYGDPSNSFSDVEFRFVMAHEMGHALGLGHEGTEAALMNSSYHFPETYFPVPQVSAHADDVQGIRSLYGDGSSYRDLAISGFVAVAAAGGGAPAVVGSPRGLTGSGSRLPPALMTVRAGQSVSLQYTIENFGTQSEVFDVAFMLSSNPIISVLDAEVGRLSGLANSAHRAITRTASVTIPFETPPGTYWIGPFVDPDDDIPEQEDPRAGAVYNNGMKIPAQLIVQAPEVQVTMTGSKRAGEYAAVGWDVVGAGEDGTTRIEFSLDNGSSWSTLASSFQGTGHRFVVIPCIETWLARIKVAVSLPGGGEASGMSSPFSIEGNDELACDTFYDDSTGAAPNGPELGSYVAAPDGADFSVASDDFSTPTFDGSGQKVLRMNYAGQAPFNLSYDLDALDLHRGSPFVIEYEIRIPASSSVPRFRDAFEQRIDMQNVDASVFPPIVTTNSWALEWSGSGELWVSPADAPYNCYPWQCLNTGSSWTLDARHLVQWIFGGNGEYTIRLDAEEIFSGVMPSGYALQAFTFSGNSLLGSAAEQRISYLTIRELRGLAVGPPTGSEERMSQLFAAAPSPFNSATTLAFSLAEAGPVQLSVYDVAGRRVRDLLNEGNHASGRRYVSWDGRDHTSRRVASGVYYYRLVTRDRALTRSVAFIR